MASLLPYAFEFTPATSGLTFLQLVNRTMRECGTSSSDTPLETAQNLSGEPLRFVDWVNQAWLELQTKHDDWPWMRSSSLLGYGVSFTTVAGQGSYGFGTGSGKVGLELSQFGRWHERSFRCFPTGVSNGENCLTPRPFEVWRNGYMFGAQRDARTRPTILAIGPDQSICLGPMPSDGWTITGDFNWQPLVMSADTDTPFGLPAQFHMLIVYQAMIYYGQYEAAPEVLARGQGGYSKLIRELQALRMASLLRVAGPLA